jgi:membrane protease YdiL (CAAX protease family)
MDLADAKLPVKVAFVLVVSYLAFSLLQATSYTKIFPDATIWDSLFGSLLFAALLFPTAYTGAKESPEQVRVIPRLFGRDPGVGPVGIILPAVSFALIAFVLNVSLSLIFGQFWVEPTAQEYVVELTLLEKIGASISAGIWEESIFRLFLISVLILILKNRMVSVVLSNLLFTLLHVVFQSPPYNAPALVIVFVIGLIYTKTYLDHGLESAIMCHATMNFLAMVLGPLLG